MIDLAIMLLLAGFSMYQVQRIFRIGRFEDSIPEELHALHITFSLGARTHVMSSRMVVGIGMENTFDLRNAFVFDHCESRALLSRALVQLVTAAYYYVR